MAKCTLSLAVTSASGLQLSRDRWGIPHPYKFWDTSNPFSPSPFRKMTAALMWGRPKKQNSVKCRDVAEIRVEGYVIWRIDVRGLVTLGGVLNVARAWNRYSNSVSSGWIYLS